MKKIELYSADWCTSCKVIKPIIESLKNIETEIVDVEQETDRAVSLRIRSIPVVILFEDDVEIKRLVGNVTKQQIEDLL